MMNYKTFCSTVALFMLIIPGLLFTGCEIDASAVYSFETDSNKRAAAQNGMVSSAHPLASEAGIKMLQNGGNAVDAAVATAFALGVVEPNMSGLGGGGSMLIWDNVEKMADYVDFYPAKLADSYRDFDHDAADEDHNLLPVGVPGSVAGLLSALDKYGNLTREEVMAPAIQYAGEGFPVYLTLGQFIRDNEEKLTRYEGTRQTFWPNGDPLSVGEILIQPELAETLQRISDVGKEAFYSGSTAEKMVEVMNEGDNPVTLEDFANYEPQWQKMPLCGSYHNYTVLSAPMPQTGVYIVQALNILEHYDLKSLGLPTRSPEAFDIMTSTLRLSTADRIEFISDPNWVNIPVNGLISKEYAQERSSQVGIGRAPASVEPGSPEQFQEMALPDACNRIEYAASHFSSVFDEEYNYFAAGHAETGTIMDEAEGSGETTHLSVIDAEGNAVSLSTTLSPVFGSGAWVDGFILNTSGFNFSRLEEDEEWESSHPYRVRASTISPTIILENNEPKLVIGAPGGGRIPTAVLQNIVYILEYGLDPLDAVKMPRIFPSRDNTEVQIEIGFQPETLHQARSMGYDIQSLSQGYARLYLVYRDNDTLIGVSDPRHDGEPRGY